MLGQYTVCTYNLQKSSLICEIISRLTFGTHLFDIFFFGLVTAEIQNYQQIAETETSITVSWTMDISSYEPIKYRMIINDLITSEFLCAESNCERIVRTLSPCTDYNLKLMAIFALKEEANTVQEITASTAYSCKHLFIKRYYIHHSQIL